MKTYLDFYDEDIKLLHSQPFDTELTDHTYKDSIAKELNLKYYFYVLRRGASCVGMTKDGKYLIIFNCSAKKIISRSVINYKPNKK